MNHDDHELKDDLILDARTRVPLERPADLAANYGYESYQELYARTKSLKHDQVVVAKLDPAEEADVRPGTHVRFADGEGRWQVLDTLHDHASGGGPTIVPGKLAIFGRVPDDWADAVGLGEVFLAAEPEGRGGDADDAQGA